MCYMMHEVQLAKSILWTLKKQIKSVSCTNKLQGKTEMDKFRHNII